MQKGTQLAACAALLALGGLITPDGRLAAQGRAEQDLSPVVRTQIATLMAEKAARTPAQRKISSQLIFEMRRARGQAAAGIEALPTGIAMRAGGDTDVDVHVDDVTPALVSAMTSLGMQILEEAPDFKTIVARGTLDQIEAVAALDAVRFVRPPSPAVTRRMPRVTPTGSVNSQGDSTHLAALARTTFGVDGTGVKIGVLSDGVGGLAASQASGNLGSVTVLPGQAGSGSEGTAMLEIIHDLAPGAQLYFATAFNGLTSFAANIRALRDAGCTIIVDDVFYFAETPFQDGQAASLVTTTNGGAVMQAVKDVSDAGVLYLSSAGNEGNLDAGTSGTWEGDFVDGGAASAPISLGRLHNFGSATYNTITGNGLGLTLHWADPLGGSANDYDLFILSSDGASIVAASTDTQSGTQDPYEDISSSVTSGGRVVIVKYSGSARFLHLGNIRGRLSSATAGEIHGHAAVDSTYAFGVAATPAVFPGPYPSAFTASNVVETFSSDGPRRMFFTSAGTAYTPGNFTASGGTVLNKPDITAADGVSTSVAGFSPFYGTSAAAPHAAAIAALIKSRNLAQTAAQVKAALFASVIDIHGAGVDRNSGAGIIMAYAGVQAASAFTDDPLQVGVTAIKAVHFSELRSTINSVRARYGLGAYDWTDATLTAGVTTIKAVHITEMRVALNAAYVSAGRTPPSYTTSTVTVNSTTIVATQLAELRAAVLVIW
nr:S8 family serine peptidase [Acidobacteriota bacterium]